MKRKRGTVKIIKHYGVANQLKKLAEEVWELNEAVLDYEHCKNKEERNLDHIIEELGDVHLLLRQIQEYYEIGLVDIKLVVTQKMSRQLQRMSEEEK